MRGARTRSEWRPSLAAFVFPGWRGTGLARSRFTVVSSGGRRIGSARSAAAAPPGHEDDEPEQAGTHEDEEPADPGRHGDAERYCAARRATRLALRRTW